MCGKSIDSNQTGLPQLAQKQRMPRPELNRLIGGFSFKTSSILKSAIAHVAGEVPENFLQFVQ
jgi:hypothetical protein